MMQKHKRIFEQITQNQLVTSFGQEIEVSYPTSDEFPPMKGRLFMFSPAQFEAMLEQVVEFTYHETFSLIKRQVNRND
jgi:hypothetical protein